MTTYRDATPDDWENIAELHALSWQLNYRGSMSDNYLDNHVVAERKSVWKQRFATVNEKQLTILAEQNNQLVGFSCIFLDDDATHGALLDNLHVRTESKRQGIGKVLMKKSAELVLKERSNQSMFLWVLTNNQNAIKFYETLGGIRHDMKPNPDCRNKDTYRYVWDDLEKLANLQ